MEAYTLFVLGRETYNSNNLEIVEAVLGCLAPTYSTYIRYNEDGVHGYEENQYWRNKDENN